MILSLRRVSVLLAAAAAVMALAGALPAGAAAATWCGGTAESAADRPDAVSALSWHVVYAYPSDAVSRFPQLVEPLVADIAAIDTWWRQQDPTRAIRWDLATFEGCAGGVAALDITSVRLPRDSSWYRAPAERWLRVRDDVVNAGFGDPAKKILVFYDGPLEQPVRECGIARTGSPSTGGRESYAVVFLDTPCGTGLGSGGFPAVAAIHEMTHSMDALVQVVAGQPGPPNVCPGDAGHPCDNATDLLYPSAGPGVLLAQKVLDYGRDDYYGHAGSWWDVQDSLFLERLDTPDRPPPAAPAGLTARASSPGTVVVSWRASPDDVGSVTYEVTRDGAVVGVTGSTSYGERIADGTTYTYAVRARDAVGRVGATASVRFTGGLGVVDATGKLVADTVPPRAPGRLRARQQKASLVLTWAAVVDAGTVTGYRVYRDDKRVTTVRVPSFTTPLARAAGTWTVRAVDRAGNIGAASPQLRVTVAARPATAAAGAAAGAADPVR